MKVEVLTLEHDGKLAWRDVDVGLGSVARDDDHSHPVGAREPAWGVVVVAPVVSPVSLGDPSARPD